VRFLSEQSESSLEEYKKLLRIVGSLSNLFSESKAPYIDSRISENIFCRAFKANNLGRSDISADASKAGIGVGIKTFLENNGRSIQKIAEFNRDRIRFSELNDEELIFEVARLRNARLQTTKSITDIEDLAYHCITRTTGLIRVYEAPMHDIELDKIGKINRSTNVIRFSDSNEEYSFNISKSVLMKRFVTPDDKLEIPVEVLDDPFDLLEKHFDGQGSEAETFENEELGQQDFVVLPLYSARSGQVEERSGLNQWNASGRKRNFDEIYIGIPSWIHRELPGFFPERDAPFDLALPNGRVLNAKVCQENSKALMSNPNSELGHWLLRDVLKLEPGELLTMDKLQDIGLDSVQITKQSEGKYLIDFKALGTFEDFKTSIEESE